MRHYFLFTYENINPKLIRAVEQTLDEQKKKTFIQYADPRGMLLIVEDSDAKLVAELAQQEIWNRNGGMLCEFREVQQDDESIADLI